MSAATANISKGAGLLQRWRRGWLRILLMLSVPLALVLAAGYLYVTGGRYVSTDDAYVQADMIAVSADVGGRVVEVDVRDNQQVTDGQLLFRLDDRPYRIALERAKAQLAGARLQIDGLRATYRQKLADLKSAQDMQNYQDREFARQQQLLAQRITPQSKFDEAQHNLEAARQKVAADQQDIANTLAALSGNPDLPTDQHPVVQQAQAQVDQAELDLSHTIVRAAANGTVTKVNKLPVGQYLTAASPAFSLVATDDLWIEANFKETELTHMRPGQPATVDIDTYPDHTFAARIESIGAGTGSEFSVLPAQNATGNWVKVVQRIPVRLTIDHPDPDRPLRVGMSATVEVDTGYRRPILQSLASALDWLDGSSRAEAAVRQ
ncbi:MAG TPA: HlyD family secretion protein [Stellaceae bacterium]|nr:HlyD family secretion protein [Stellaceae bacterium]